LCPLLVGIYSLAGDLIFMRFGLRYSVVNPKRFIYDKPEGYNQSNEAKEAFVSSIKTAFIGSIKTGKVTTLFFKESP